MAKPPKAKLPEPQTRHVLPPWNPPPHAAQIWQDAHGNLCLGLPSAHGNQGHTLHLPKDPKLLAKSLGKILGDRKSAPLSRIGQDSSPTNAMLGELVARWSGKIHYAELREDNLTEDDFLV